MKREKKNGFQWKKYSKCSSSYGSNAFFFCTLKHAAYCDKKGEWDLKKKRKRHLDNLLYKWIYSNRYYYYYYYIYNYDYVLKLFKSKTQKTKIKHLSIFFFFFIYTIQFMFGQNKCVCTQRAFFVYWTSDSNKLCSNLGFSWPKQFFFLSLNQSKLT